MERNESNRSPKRRKGSKNKTQSFESYEKRLPEYRQNLLAEPEAAPLASADLLTGAAPKQKKRPQRTQKRAAAPAAAGVAAEEPIEQATYASSDGGNGTNRIATVLTIAALAALVGFFAILIYKNTVYDPAEKEYEANIYKPAPADYAVLPMPHAQPIAPPQPGSIPPSQYGVANSVPAGAINPSQPVVIYLFNLDSKGVPEKKVLTKLAKEIGNNGNVRIEAYTDQSGSDAYNLALSQRRADAVAKYLAAHGVNPTHIIAHGNGETSAFATPQQCRRAEIYVSDK